jgi:hypothetical protein
MKELVNYDKNANVSLQIGAPAILFAGLNVVCLNDTDEFFEKFRDFKQGCREADGIMSGINETIKDCYKEIVHRTEANASILEGFIVDEMKISVENCKDLTEERSMTESMQLYNIVNLSNNTLTPDYALTQFIKIKLLITNNDEKIWLPELKRSINELKEKFPDIIKSLMKALF